MYSPTVLTDHVSLNLAGTFLLNPVLLGYYSEMSESLPNYLDEDIFAYMGEKWMGRWSNSLTGRGRISEVQKKDWMGREREMDQGGEGGEKSYLQQRGGNVNVTRHKVRDRD